MMKKNDDQHLETTEEIGQDPIELLKKMIELESEIDSSLKELGKEDKLERLNQLKRLSKSEKLNESEQLYNEIQFNEKENIPIKVSTTTNDQPTITQNLDPDSLLTTAEAAKYLRVKPSTLEQWRWTGSKLQYIKIGRLVKYRKSDLDSFVSSMMCSSTTEAAYKRKK